MNFFAQSSFSSAAMNLFKCWYPFLTFVLGIVLCLLKVITSNPSRAAVLFVWDACFRAGFWISLLCFNFFVTDSLNTFSRMVFLIHLVAEMVWHILAWEISGMDAHRLRWGYLSLHLLFAATSELLCQWAPQDRNLWFGFRFQAWCLGVLSLILFFVLPDPFWPRDPTPDHLSYLVVLDLLKSFCLLLLCAVNQRETRATSPMRQTTPAVEVQSYLPPLEAVAHPRLSLSLSESPAVVSLSELPTDMIKIIS